MAGQVFTMKIDNPEKLRRALKMRSAEMRQPAGKIMEDILKTALAKEYRALARADRAAGVEQAESEPEPEPATEPAPQAHRRRHPLEEAEQRARQTDQVMREAHEQECRRQNAQRRNRRDAETEIE